MRQQHKEPSSAFVLIVGELKAFGVGGIKAGR